MDNCRIRPVRLETVLRILIVAALLLPIAAATLDMLAPGLLPPELAAYSESQAEEPVGVAVSGILLLALVVPLLASVVGLWLFKPWARWLYTAVTAAAFLIAPFDPPWVGSSVASSLNDLAILCDGALLALIWFSDLRGRFERA